MKTEFSDVLKSWQPEVPEPADFRRGVWARIEVQSSAAPWWTSLLLLFARPQVAFALAAFALIVGGVSGTALARGDGTDAYLRSVNPYAMAK